MLGITMDTITTMTTIATTAILIILHFHNVLVTITIPVVTTMMP